MKITVDLVASKSTVIFVMPRRTVWKVSIVCQGKFLADQPIIRAEEFKLHRCWLGSWFEAVDVAANRLEEVGAAADVDVGAAEVVGGDIKKLAVAACGRNQLAII